MAGGLTKMLSRELRLVTELYRKESLGGRAGSSKTSGERGEGMTFPSAA